ncbi:sensor histidine kinase, partial [Streptomyces sp. McG8]
APGPGARRGNGTAPRPERREGGRHGRPPARPAPGLPESHMRSQLLRLAVLPPVAVALSACAAVLFTVRSSGMRPTGALWLVLGGATAVALAGIVIAAVAAERAARSVHDRVGALRRGTARREADLRALVEALRNGEQPPPRARRTDRTDRIERGDGGDEFDQLAADLARAHDGAVTAVVQAAQLSSQAGSEQKLEVFVNLARRLQSLVHREISILDELENEMEDPDLLKGLFHVDHLATRIRRHAENLAVLGGAVSRRQWSNPVPMTEVLRSAIAEVEQYSRVKLVPPVDGTLRGHAVADVIHLLAELVENATVFSAPHTQVLLRANLVTSGLAVEVEDRGLGMPVGEQDRMNALLADPDQVHVASLLADGRIGLFVVSQLARRHGIHVRLQTNIYGGVQAVLVVPQSLLGGEPAAVNGAQGTTASLPPVDGGTGPTGRRTPALPGTVDTRADAPAHARETPAAGNTPATPLT